MSREAINRPDTRFASGIGDDQYPPWSTQNQASHDVSATFVDGSGPIFSMYLEMASEEDKKMTERWKADADGILIFTGLFSASVASLISVSIQDIRPNPQDTSNFYLANIYHTVSDPNISSSLLTSPPTFTPPNYAVWVNALWFLSLVISLTCALLATLLQQWARRYLKVTQPRYGPHKRARIRAFFAEGVEKFLLPWAVEALPTLLHVSLFLFFAGLVVFLWNVNPTISKLVLSWVGACTALYGCTTIMPIFRHDSPYYTPLTSLVWSVVVGVPYVFYGVLQWFTSSVYLSDGDWDQFGGLEESYRKLLVQGVQKTAEETALNSPSEIDTRAFMWTFDSLDEDHELERFFSGLPGFRSSKVVDDPLPNLFKEQRWKLFTGLVGLLDRTFSSDLLPEPVKRRRAMMCAKATDPAHIPAAFYCLDRILSYYQDSGPLVAEIVRIVRGWGNNRDEDTLSITDAMVSSVLARAQQRDDPWFILASNELGVPELVVRNLATHGDSLSLAILIHVTRQQFSNYRKLTWPSYAFSNVLEAACNLNVQDTSPELQHEFCVLWNQIVLKVQNDNNGWMAAYILKPIRNVYVALHQDTEATPTQFSATTGNQDDILRRPSSYPLCNIPGHHSDLTSHIHDDSASPTFAHIAAPASIASPDGSSSSVPVPLHMVSSPADVPPLNDIYTPGSSHPARQTSVESLRIPTTPLDPAIAVTSGITIHYPTPETSTSAPTLSVTSPPITVAFQHNADLLIPSNAPNLGMSDDAQRMSALAHRGPHQA
ncbi:hypothetical protein EDB87DRAFT_1823780 [Lactarius vividus]|nr:hypothetical protein EDB87DRAFT_1823780 [Lactarius vividus]